MLFLQLAPGLFQLGARFAGGLLIQPFALPVLTENLNGAGAFSLSIPYADLPPDFLHTPLYLQAAVVPPTGPIRASNSIVVLIR